MSNLAACLLTSKMDSSRGVQFALKQETDIDLIFSALCQEYPLHKAYPTHIQRQYLDSFDWRLYQRGYICGIDNHSH
jgi:hypothetical protein